MVEAREYAYASSDGQKRLKNNCRYCCSRRMHWAAIDVLPNGNNEMRLALHAHGRVPSRYSGLREGFTW